MVGGGACNCVALYQRLAEWGQFDTVSEVSVDAVTILGWAALTWHCLEGLRIQLSLRWQQHSISKLPKQDSAVHLPNYIVFL